MLLRGVARAVCGSLASTTRDLFGLWTGVDDVVRFNTHFYSRHESQQSAIFDPEATDDH